MVTVEVRDGRDAITITAEIFNGDNTQEAANRSLEAQGPSQPENAERAHWYYGVPFAGVRYYGFDQRPVVAKRFSPAKAGRGAGA